MPASPSPRADTSRFDLRSELSSLCRQNPWWAHERFFAGYHDSASPTFHQQLVELMWDGRQTQSGAAVFRGGAKSTRAEECLALGMCIGAFRYAVILASNETLAVQKLRSVKHYLEHNELLLQCFGDIAKEAEVWQERSIIARQTCIQAYGSGQSVRGMKYLDNRPDLIVIDDLEELSLSCDNVSTPEKRENLWRWLHADFLNIVAKDAKVLIIGSILHEDSALARLCRSSLWRIIKIPIETVTDEGKTVPSWPSRYPLDWIEQKRKEAIAHGNAELFEREFMCNPVATTMRQFTRSQLKCDPTRLRAFEPEWIIYDPARTTNTSSCSTGKIVASWFGGKLLVWEASANYWKPDEIIEDVFAADRKWNPVAIGIEKTGLNEFVEQPLRQAQITRGHPLPIKYLDAPRDQGKDAFILGLQPFANAGELVLCGMEDQFRALIDEMVGFPYGKKDVVNALAYMLKIRPGQPVYPEFSAQHISDEVAPSSGTWVLSLGSDGVIDAGVLAKAGVSSLWIEMAWAALPIDEICYQARLAAGERQLPAYAIVDSVFGDIAAKAAACGIRLLKAGDSVQGRGEITRRLRAATVGPPHVRINSKAAWAIRAFSGGYCWDDARKELCRGVYRLLLEPLESVVAVGAPLTSLEGVSWATARDGSRYITAVVEQGRRRVSSPA